MPSTHARIDRPYPHDRETSIVRFAFARIDPIALGAAIGVVFAVILAGATIFLLLAGAAPGVPVGPHLALIGQFMPFYSVSWTGSVIGAVGAGGVGFVFGLIIAAGWNASHQARLMFVLRRSNPADLA